MIVNLTICNQSYEGQISFNMFNSCPSISEQQIDNAPNIGKSK